MSRPVISTAVPEIIAASIFGYTGIVETDINTAGTKQLHLALHNQDGSYITYTVPDSNGNPNVVYPTVTIERAEATVINDDFFDTVAAYIYLRVRKFLTFYGNITVPGVYGISVNSRHPSSSLNKVLFYQNFDQVISAYSFVTYIKSIALGNMAFESPVSTPSPSMQSRSIIYMPTLAQAGALASYKSIFEKLTPNTNGVYIGLLLGTQNQIYTMDAYNEDSGTLYYLYEPSAEMGYARQKMEATDWDYALTQHLVVSDVTYAAPSIKVTNNKVVTFPALVSAFPDPIMAVTVSLSDEVGETESRLLTLPLKARTSLNPGDASPNFQIGKLKFTLTTGDIQYSL